MTSPITQIEDIILQDDIRGMKALRVHMNDGWLDSSAQLLLDHPGKIVIVTRDPKHRDHRSTECGFIFSCQRNR